MVVIYPMDWDHVWKAVMVVIAGTVLLRVAGRKTISQMTLAETVLMIGIGSLLIQPVAGEDIWTTILVGSVLVGTLLLMEYLQVKSDTVEKLITGKAKIVIENGNLNEKNLRKLRLTVDQLEMKLRQNSVSKISDVRWATLEPNGQLGYELKQDAQPVTKKDLEEFKQTFITLLASNSKDEQIHKLLEALNKNNEVKIEENIFAEIQKSHKTPPPNHLQ